MARPLRPGPCSYWVRRGTGVGAVATGDSATTPLAPASAAATTPSASTTTNWLFDDLDLLAAPVLQPAAGDTATAATTSSTTGSAALFDWSAGGSGTGGSGTGGSGTGGSDTGAAPASRGLDLSALLANGPAAAPAAAAPSAFVVPALPALLGQPVLSERAQRLLDGLPDLSFMSSRLITFLNAPVAGNAHV